jgi:ABC-type sulfate transport system permease component
MRWRQYLEQEQTNSARLKEKQNNFDNWTFRFKIYGVVSLFVIGFTLAEMKTGYYFVRYKGFVHKHDPQSWVDALSQLPAKLPLLFLTFALIFFLSERKYRKKK